MYFRYISFKKYKLSQVHLVASGQLFITTQFLSHQYTFLKLFFPVCYSDTFINRLCFHRSGLFSILFLYFLSYSCFFYTYSESQFFNLTDTILFFFNQLYNVVINVHSAAAVQFVSICRVSVSNCRVSATYCTVTGTLHCSFLACSTHFRPLVIH